MFGQGRAALVSDAVSWVGRDWGYERRVSMQKSATGPAICAVHLVYRPQWGSGALFVCELFPYHASAPWMRIRDGGIGFISSFHSLPGAVSGVCDSVRLKRMFYCHSECLVVVKSLEATGVLQFLTDRQTDNADCLTIVI